jgi:hypothetical protein
MVFKNFSNSLIPLSHKKVGFLLLLISLVHLTFTNCLLNAQSSDQKLRITYNNNLINISAEDADLQNVLLKIADNTNIYVRFPATLEKKITISKKKISLRDALTTILRGLNYAIIYSGSDKNQTFISKVFVFKKSKKSRQQRVNEATIANRMRAYQKQFESLKKNLLTIDESSRRGKRYLRRIRILEKRMERLQGQYN